MRVPRLPELLCPPASLPALQAAPDHGADAVYLGLKDNTNTITFAQGQRGASLPPQKSPPASRRQCPSSSRRQLAP